MAFDLLGCDYFTNNFSSTFSFPSTEIKPLPTELRDLKFPHRWTFRSESFWVMTHQGLVSQPRRPETSSSLQNLKRLIENRCVVLLPNLCRKREATHPCRQRLYRSYNTEGNQREAKLQLWITTCLIESDVPILRHPPDFTLSPLISITPSSTSLYNMPALCSKIHETASRIHFHTQFPAGAPSCLLFARNKPHAYLSTWKGCQNITTRSLTIRKKLFQSHWLYTYVRNKFQLEHRFQVVKMKSMGNGGEILKSWVR